MLISLFCRTDLIMFAAFDDVDDDTGYCDTTRKYKR
jgi:hypothetical protein